MNLKLINFYVNIPLALMMCTSANAQESVGDNFAPSACPCTRLESDTGYQMGGSPML